MKLTNPKSIALATAGLLALLANAGTYTWIGGSTNDPSACASSSTAAQLRTAR